jgi:hypothetical protein
VGFAEVMQPIDALSVAVEQQQHRARPVLLPREQKQVIGAEVEHEMRRKGNGGKEHPRPAGSAVVGLPGGLLQPGDHHSAAPEKNLTRVQEAGGEAFGALRRLSPSSRKISEFSSRRSAMAAAMVVLCRMLPHSEKAVFVVISVLRLWA